MSELAMPSRIERELIEEFGNIYESQGHRRLQGLIVGLLLTKGKPVSLDDMVEILDRSKGPISISVRRLDELDLVRKVGGPNNRRNYYAAHANIFFNNFKTDMASVRKNRSLAERFLAQVDPDEDESEKTEASLQHMKAFYELLESHFEEFAKKWQEVRRERLENEDVGTGEATTPPGIGT